MPAAPRAAARESGQSDPAPATCISSLRWRATPHAAPGRRASRRGGGRRRHVFARLAVALQRARRPRAACTSRRASRAPRRPRRCRRHAAVPCATTPAPSRNRSGSTPVVAHRDLVPEISDDEVHLEASGVTPQAALGHHAAEAEAPRRAAPCRGHLARIEEEGDVLPEGAERESAGEADAGDDPEHECHATPPRSHACSARIASAPARVRAGARERTPRPDDIQDHHGET